MNSFFFKISNFILRVNAFYFLRFLNWYYITLPSPLAKLPFPFSNIGNSFSIIVVVCMFVCVVCCVCVYFSLQNNSYNLLSLYNNIPDNFELDKPTGVLLLGKIIFFACFQCSLVVSSYLSRFQAARDFCCPH